jgi:kumamolisin
VAIAEFGGGYFASDLAAFCSKEGLAVPTADPVGVSGAPVLSLQQIERMSKLRRSQQLGESMEVNMDVQIIAGLCPAATIIVYFARFDEQGWIDLINQVIAQQPTPAVTLSVSWGLAEDDPDWSAAALQEINGRLQAASVLGITVCVAAGDDGSGDQETDGRAHVDFPSSSPYVLAVGGTMIDTAGNEVVWWESPGQRTQNGGGATGGGVSVEFPKPSWQAGVQVASLNAGSIAGRIVPDVAALAGPPLYDLIFVGQDSPNGGTSAATPTWAALIARMAGSQPAQWRPGFLPPLLYQQEPGTGMTVGTVGCADITSGNNQSPQPGKGYQAGPGFDAVSGWGVPNGVALLGALARASPPAQA